MRKYKHREFHGGTGTRLYAIWKGIKARCFNPNDNGYCYYGARGISMDEGWKDSFVEFRSWAIRSGYEPHLSIDRINNDGNYVPSNCRWTVDKVQNRNTRRNRSVVRSDGREFQCAQEAAECVGIHKSTIAHACARGTRAAGFHWRYL